MFFDPNITNALRNALPWAGLFFRFITELGSELFYISLILIGYWAFKKKEAILTALVLLVSVLTNYWLKLAIANPRPDQSYWYPGMEATNYSTPSGHAQNSTMLFGWIALHAKKPWVTLLSFVLIILIGISRVYLGVHYLGDVLIGWIVGAVIVAIIYRVEQPLGAFLSGYRKEHLYLAMFLFGLIATILSTYLLPWPPDDNFGALGGLTMGIAIGFLLEDRYVKFEMEPPDDQRWRLVLRVVFGLILVLAMMIFLKGLLPTVDVWSRALRYFLIAIVGAFVWPLLFKRLGL